VSDTLARAVLHGSDWTFIRLGGALTVGALEPALGDQVRGTLLLVDMSGIERTEPAGLAQWSDWLATATSGHEAVLVNCSQAIVGGLRQLESLAKNASVMSVCAPYFCESCDAERESVLVLRRLPTPLAAPPQPCRVCGQPTEFDDIEATWFRFLDHVRPTEPDARIEHALAEARAMLGEGPSPPARKPALGAVTERVLEVPDIEDLPPVELDPIAEADAAPEAWDTGFWLAVGVLLAVLSLVVLQLVGH